MSLSNLIAALKLNGARYAIGLRPAATDPAADDFVPATSGTNGGLLVEYPAGATAPLPADAATETTLAAVLAKIIAAPATAALQTAANALLTTIAALLPSPTVPTAITASDATDLTLLVNVGVLVGGSGDLAFRLAGAPSTTVTLAVVAGQFVPGQFTRVMAATTATGLVGLGR